MKLNQLKLAIAALILVCTSNRALAQKSIPEKIDSLFAEYTSETPGVAVAVVRNNEIVFKKGYGLANLEHGVPITPGTVFNIASVSKQFTAFAIYLLEKQGRLSFEDDIKIY